ncbi:hypothetical protein KM043_008253 [Ampulex compressa]|nr:hypothetical protein KM043_008253 [Ampulex compressa]
MLRKRGGAGEAEKEEEERTGNLVCRLRAASEISEKPAGNDNKNNHLNKLNPDSPQAVCPLPGCGSLIQEDLAAPKEISTDKRQVMNANNPASLFT